MKNTCISCKILVTNQAGTVSFKCPSCGKEEFVRCGTCRKIGNKYSCPSCKFTGPN